jgi:hypothetical protein
VENGPSGARKYKMISNEILENCSLWDPIEIIHDGVSRTVYVNPMNRAEFSLAPVLPTPFPQFFQHIADAGPKWNEMSGRQNSGSTTSSEQVVDLE